MSAYLSYNHGEPTNASDRKVVEINVIQFSPWLVLENKSTDMMFNFFFHLHPILFFILGLSNISNLNINRDIVSYWHIWFYYISVLSTNITYMYRHWGWGGWGMVTKCGRTYIILWCDRVVPLAVASAASDVVSHQAAFRDCARR